jgi:two-component system, sensor histidine kinase PdtaS
MRLPAWTDHLPGDVRLHLGNVADNLQLVADLGFSDVALAVADQQGQLRVVADARPSNAVYPFSAPRVDVALTPADEPEAHAALESGRQVSGSRRRLARDMTYRTEAYPIGAPQPVAVVLRMVGEQVEADPGHMERSFIASARDLLHVLRRGPLRDTHSGEPFATTRRAGDGVLRVDDRGRVTYASPNAVTIMRLAGVESRVTGVRAAELPGGAFGISPVLGGRGALALELEVAERVLSYRVIALRPGALVLVEDLTEARRREREIGIKEATIREVHHRVKNNLQTIASLFRIQARRSDNPEVHHALAEATERAAAMAAVHDLLARSEHESVDFAEAAGRIVNLVRDGIAGGDTGITVTMHGSSGQIDAKTATPLALVLAELVHNALEHAFEHTPDGGAVRVTLRRDVATLQLVVQDDGDGLPAGFDLATSTGLGFSIIRTLVEEDLRGAMEVTGGAGTRVAITVPLRAPAAADTTTTAAKDGT